jgi:DNA-binding winged helix-turn-helix (wHTH) protein/Tfp pilus assembly protein PilF
VEVAPQQEINCLSGDNRQNGSELLDTLKPVQRVRFGVFEIDLESEELHKRGVRLRLQKKPFQILKRLLETPGELVSRDDLAKQLWPDLHVLFDKSLNTAVNTLRRTLGDPSSNPRFIETRTGVGYRFIAPAERLTRDGSALRANRNHVAYQDYWKGRYFYEKMTEDGLRQSVAHFESAIAADPDYALAHAGLADTYIRSAFLSGGTLERAQKHADCALRNDPQVADAHVSLAQLKHLCDGDLPAAEAAYRRALNLDNNSARAHQFFAAFLSSNGRANEARDQIQMALELSPLSLVINMEAAWQLYVACDYQGAAEQSWRTLALEPRFAPAQHTLGLAYEQLGMLDEALVELQNARECSGGHPIMVASLSHAHATVGNHTQASQVLQELKLMAQARHVSQYWLAIVHAGLGHDELAAEALQAAVRDRDLWTTWLRVDPRLTATLAFFKLKQDAYKS